MNESIVYCFLVFALMAIIITCFDNSKSHIEGWQGFNYAALRSRLQNYNNRVRPRKPLSVTSAGLSGAAIGAVGGSALSGKFSCSSQDKEISRLNTELIRERGEKDVLIVENQTLNNELTLERENLQSCEADAATRPPCNRVDQEQLLVAQAQRDRYMELYEEQRAAVRSLQDHYRSIGCR